MKIIILILMLLSTNSFASDRSYDVSGEDEYGREIEGTIESNNGEREVSGELTDENGNTYSFNG